MPDSGYTSTVGKTEQSEKSNSTMDSFPKSDNTVQEPIERRWGVSDDIDDEHITMSREKKKMNRKKRVVMKGGSTSVDYKNISKKRRRYFCNCWRKHYNADHNTFFPEG